MPDFLEGENLEYLNYSGEFEKSKTKLVFITKPISNPAAALGIRLGCTKIRGRKVCLECGWLYCKIVIYL